MHAIHDWLLVDWLMLPRYVWALLIAVGAFNEAIRVSKWTRAQSIWQGIWAFLLWLPIAGALLARVPWAGDFLRYLAGRAPAPWNKPAIDETPTEPMRRMPAIIPVLMLCALSACAAARYRTLSGAAEVLGVVAEKLPAIANAQEREIMGSSPSPKQANDELKTWRTAVDVVTVTIDSAVTAIEYAKSKSSAVFARAAFAAVEAVLEILRRYNIHIPGVL